jgi:hypothetical protein
MSPSSGSPSSEPVFATFVAMLIDTLAGLVPGSDDDTATRDTRRAIARLMFEAFRPRDAIEAMAAARAVAAHQAAMDNFARAAKPDTSDEKAIRLRANAIAASRSFDAVLRTLEKRRKEAVQPAPTQGAETPDANGAGPRLTAAQRTPGQIVPGTAVPPGRDGQTPIARRTDDRDAAAQPSAQRRELAPADS